jgi:hypothetical protein
MTVDAFFFPNAATRLLRNQFSKWFDVGKFSGVARLNNCLENDYGAAAGIRTRVPGCFLLEWEAGVIDQAARHVSSTRTEMLALDHGRRTDPSQLWLVSIFACSGLGEISNAYYS